MWVYRRMHVPNAKAGYWAYFVGFFDPEGSWYTEGEYYKGEEAAWRVHFLNGGSRTLRRKK